MVDVTIIGCGIIGASVAYELARYRLRVRILERENDVAMGTTKANSAIVHAGYDPPHGTLMASLNVRGAALMEGLCRDLSVGYRRVGSFVLGFSEGDVKTLREIYDNGVRNGVPDLALLSGDEARALEPALAGTVTAALYAPTAAVIDPWGLCIAEAEVAVRSGAELHLRTAVTGIADAGDHLCVQTNAGSFDTRFLINCAGVQADEIDRMAGGHAFRIEPSRGEYYLLDKSSGELVQHVIFQCPTASGKGVLIAPTVHGNLIVGPNAEAVTDANDRATTLAGLSAVSAAARRSVPSVNFRESIRNFAGIRAASDHADFIIGAAAAMPRLLHVAGIKSPGLSAAPAIAELAVQQLAEAGLPLTRRDDFDGTRSTVHFKERSAAEKAALVRENPLYGRVLCRCETITEGEIMDAIHSPIPPCSVDGVKRRAGAGMGRCQGGFCGPRVLELLARELGRDPMEILQDQDGTRILTSRTKEGSADA